MLDAPGDARRPVPGDPSHLSPTVSGAPLIKEDAMDGQIGTAHPIAPHDERAAAVWSSGGRDYEEIVRGIYDGIDATIAGFAPQMGERILDVATGTGIAARACARRGARVTGIDIAAGLLDAAHALSGGLAIDYRLGDAAAPPFPD